MDKKKDLKATVLGNISALAGEKEWGRTARFAKDVGISTKHAGDILDKGVMPKIDTLQKIANAFDLSIDVLLQPQKKKPRLDPDLVEMIVLQKRSLEIAKKDRLYRRNLVEGIKLHIEMNEKKLEHEFTGMVDVMYDMSKRIFGRKKTKK